MYVVSAIFLGLILLANEGSAFFPIITFYPDAQNGALTGSSGRGSSLCRWYNVQPPYMVGSSSQGSSVGTNWGGSLGSIDSLLNALYPINGMGTSASSGQRRPAVVVRVDESTGVSTGGTGLGVNTVPRRGASGVDYYPNAGEDYYYEGGRRAPVMGPQNYGDAATSYDDYSGYYYDDYAEYRAYDWLPAPAWPATSVGGIYERLYGTGTDLPSMCSICAMMG
ncbi:uncharacterized protein LOC118459936 [Anopheles albimanus]|uniref:Uncharacterized protein n=1 Tax=Anopheles albimanus TaxID=7167 RepID=A0A182FQY3_ANOAL|nr:uncharacterized protein LOC118459936 [Anopheles albimanus]